MTAPEPQACFGGAVGLSPREHSRHCYWDFRAARWVCPRRPQPPG